MCLESPNISAFSNFVFYIYYIFYYVNNRTISANLLRNGNRTINYKDEILNCQTLNMTVTVTKIYLSLNIILFEMYLIKLYGLE